MVAMIRESINFTSVVHQFHNSKLPYQEQALSSEKYKVIQNVKHVHVHVHVYGWFMQHLALKSSTIFIRCPYAM